MSVEGWPSGVSRIDIDDLNKLGRDDRNRLYWDGAPIVTSVFLGLTRVQKIATILVGLTAFLGGIGSAAQGWAAYHDWACKVKWWAVVCPPPESPASGSVKPAAAASSAIAPTQR